VVSKEEVAAGRKGSGGAMGVDHSPPTAEKMYENGCKNFRRRRRMYEFLVV
jgi:hypothetical protein